MFYADFVLSKKGPLARIWLAAHWDKKLTKAQIFETNIESSIERILKPKVKLALRTSGHLMLGVVRIYSRKTKYLLADCNEAFVKIKMAFRPGMVDLPEDHREAAVNAVTLPEVFHDFDSAMPDLNDVDIEAQFTLNQSRADEITMREDNVSVLNPIEEYGVSFDNKGFDNAVSHVSDDVFREGSLGAGAQDNLFFDNFGAVVNKDRQSNVNISALENHVSASNFDGVGLFEDFPGLPGSDNISVQIGDSIHNDAIPSTSKGLSPEPPRLDLGSAPLNDDDDDDFGNDYIPTSPGGGSSDGSRPVSPLHAGPSVEGNTVPTALPGAEFLPPTDLNEQPNAQINLNEALDAEPANENVESNENQNAEQTTLLQNEEESFALAPVDASALKGLPKTKRKRKLIVDEVKNISGEEMKAQLSDTSDIVITLDLAPPTKRLMHWKETGGVEKLFALPGRCIPSTALFKNYQRHLTSRAAPNDEGAEDRDIELRDGDVLELAAPQAAPVTGRRGRKRKQAVDEEEQLADVAAQEVQKKTKTSPQINEEQHLPTIPEEPFANELVPTDQDVADPAALPQNIEELKPFANELVPTDQDVADPVALPQNIEDLIPPMSVPPVTMDENNQQLPPPFPVQDQNLAERFSMMENMGYDGQDQEIPNPEQNPGLFNFNEDLEHNPVTPGLNAGGGGVTPWHDADYDNPVSVGPPMEEQRADETLEQFEERILNKRAGYLYDAIKNKISIGTVTTFSDLIIGNPRKQVAQKFYSLLVLKKHKILELTQEVPYSTIHLTKGSNFDAPKL